MKQKIYNYPKTVLLFLILFFMIFNCSFILKGEILLPELDYQSFQLDNGLEVYVFEDDSIPMVEFSIYYKVGAIDEEKGLTGISHFLEHAMFLGTEALAKGKLDELISSVGGSLNAYTSYDHTSYYYELPSSMLELAVALEADRMDNLRIDSKEIEREREVIRQERRSRIENDVFEAGLEKIQASTFPESSLNHQVIGWLEDVNSISVEDLENYYRNYYAPNNAVLVITGDAKIEDVEILVSKYFGSYERNEVSRPEFITDAQSDERLLEIESHTNVPLTAMYYKVPAGDHPDMMAINVLLNILVNLESSRIIQELQIKENLIMGAEAIPFTMREPGFTLIYQIPMDESLVANAQEAFDREIEKIINTGISQEELEIVKKSVEKELIFMQKNPESMASNIAVGKLNYDNPEFILDNLENLNQLTVEDIKEVAKKYFRKENRTVGNILPISN